MPLLRTTGRAPDLVTNAWFEFLAVRRRLPHGVGMDR
jgi:hypothetical protein